MPTPRILAEGLAMGESPRWHSGRLWVCDWGTRQVLSVDPSGRRTVEAEVPSSPVCIDWLPDGRLLAVSGGERRLLRQQSDGSLVLHADLSPVCDRPWNEVVTDSHGNAYANTIGFDLMAGEAPSDGAIALVPSTGAVRRVADDLAFPNGMVLTPDGSTLIVAESYAGRITAFDVDDDGSLSRRRVWADVGDGAPDGICLDAQGAIWYADVPNQRCVRVREGGQVLASIGTDRGCFSCALGGAEGRTLFVVSAQWPPSSGALTGQVLAVDVDVPAP